MIRIIEYNPTLSETKAYSLHNLVSYLGSGHPTWIDIESITEDEIGFLSENFNLHPLALEDIKNLNQRPKIEDYGEYSFIVLHTVHLRKNNSVHVKEIHFFFNSSYLITIHKDPEPIINHIWKLNSTSDHCILRSGVDSLLHLLADQIVDSSFPILDEISKDISKLEASLWKENSKNMIESILYIKRSLLRMKRTLSPQRDVFQYLSRYDSKFINEKIRFYFRDVYDHLIRIHETIEIERDILGNLLDAYFSLVSQKTNETVKKLTLVSFIFLPLTFITGFFGMNFAQIPFDISWIYHSTLAIIIILPIFLLLYFGIRKWL